LLRCCCLERRQPTEKTNPVGVALVIVGEERWRPAVDRRADVLVGADDNGEDDEEQDGVSVV